MTKYFIEIPYKGPQGEACRTLAELNVAEAEYKSRCSRRIELPLKTIRVDPTPIKVIDDSLRQSQPWEQFVERAPEYWETVSLKDVPTPSQRADALALARELKDEETRAWKDSVTIDSLLR